MGIRFKHAAIAVGICAVCLSFATAKHAVRGGEFQPIIVTTPVEDFTAGDSIPVTVTTQGPAAVSVYSDPPGAVVGSGSTGGTEADITATTSTSANGDVTIYAITDGETYVTTDVYAESGSGSNPGGQG